MIAVKTLWNGCIIAAELVCDFLACIIIAVIFMALTLFERLYLDN